MKTEEQRIARELRAEAWSVKQIARHLGASTSSVSVWVRDVPLSTRERRALAGRITEARIESNARIRERAQRHRQTYQNEGRLLAGERDASYAAGCMLYWAEGSKRRNQLTISNADPDLLLFFANFLRRHFDVDEDAFRIHCHLFADHIERQREIETYWLSRLGLPASSLRKSMVNVYSKYSAKKRANKLPYGTCKLVVNDTRILQTIYGSIQEYGGFERPEWLE